VRVAVVVSPRSSRDEVAGWKGDELLVRVSAPPQGGKANAAVCRAIADALDVPKSAVRVVRGHAARHKSVEIDVDASRLTAAFGPRDSHLG
jgi:uncharacterized protein (TIGR00251 family)